MSEFFTTGLDPFPKIKGGKSFSVGLESVIPDGVNIANRYLPLNVPLIDPQDLPVGVSFFGLPVFDNIRFLDGAYSNQNNERVKYSGLLINTVVFEASQTKNIVRTVVQGRERSIKEYISGSDIDILISGVIVNDIFRDSYPKRDVERFIKLMKVPQSLKIQSKFINNIVETTSITIESWKLIQTAGTRNVQAFTINATSDVISSINDLTGQVK